MKISPITPRLGILAVFLGTALSGCTPAVIKAAREGTAKDLEAAFNAGANPNLQVEHGRSLLHLAVVKGQTAKVKILIENKADLTATDADFKTPLMYAAERGYNEIALALLSAGSNVNARTPDERGIAQRSFTPLMFAAKNGNARIAEELIKRGADPLAEDNNLQPASVWAKKGGHAELWKYLDNEESKARAAKDTSAEEVVKEIPSDVDEPKYTLPENPNNFAIVIGIENYSDIPKADFAQHDASAVRQHLIAMGYPPRNIQVLTGKRATKTGIQKYVEAWLPKMVNENSTVFFYYSGHGAPDTNSGQAYLVPFDGDPQFLEQTAYSVKNLYNQLNSLKAKQVLVAMDSCFSGSGGRSVLPKGARPLVSKIDMGTMAVEEKDSKIVAFSASQADQISGTVEDQHHGAFTYHLLKGLNGAAADKYGSVTGQSLYNYLKPAVEDAARRQNRQQIPMLMPDNEASRNLKIK